MEALTFSRAMVRVGDWRPWRDEDEPPAVVYLVGFMIHMLLGGVFTLAAGESGMISNPFSAVTFGIAAVKVVEELAQIPRLTPSDPGPPPEPPPRPNPPRPGSDRGPQGDVGE